MGIRILSLGEIITQNQKKTLDAFARLINPVKPESVMRDLAGLLMSPETLEALDLFKRGIKREDEFTAFMIAKIKATFGVELTLDNFYGAWNEMNPKFAEFRERLEDVLRTQEMQHIVFVSYTNPIDMRHLITELRANGVPCTLDTVSGELNRIDTIPLYTTYSEKKSKAELIVDRVQHFSPKAMDTTTPSFFPPAPVSPADIKYVRGINGPTDPLVTALSECSNTEVAAVNAALGVPTLFWNKAAGQTFHDAIVSKEVHMVAAPKL